MIGDGIQVRVLRVGKDGVRLGIVAPPHVPVHRQDRIDDDMILFTYDGDQPKQQTIHDELPKPAHQVG